MQIKPISLVQFNQGLSSKSRYALLSYSTTNLGDEIQSIAAGAFLPRVDALVDRDELSRVTLDVPHKIILNGWYSHKPENWPPSNSLLPLILSFHISREVSHKSSTGRAFVDCVSDKDSISYLNAHSPIGARDFYTKQQLSEYGVGSYFSGCMTLTLTPTHQSERGRYGCVNDVDDEIIAFVRKKSDLPLYRTWHENSTERDPLTRFQLARDLLSIYSSASFVVTSRLHCALPCLALGTPVLFCPAANDTYRFSGLRDLLRLTSRQDLLLNATDFDFRAPSPNSDAYLSFRHNLIERCNAFLRR